MKRLGLLIFFAALQVSLFAQADIIDNIADAVKTSNAAKLASYFDETIDLKVVNQQELYSKAQAELIVKSFFEKNPAKNFSFEHKSSPKNGSQYAIGTLDAGSKKYRIYILLKKSGETKYLVRQFRIEQEHE